MSARHPSPHRRSGSSRNARIRKRNVPGISPVPKRVETFRGRVHSSGYLSVFSRAGTLNTCFGLLPGALATFAGQIDPRQSTAGLWWLPLAAYLLGSIPFGFLIVKLIGAGDIRFRGSGNIGATNVAREAGALPGLATLLLDGGKGYFSVWLTARLTDGNPRWMILAARFAGFHLGGGLSPVVRLPALRSPPCAA